MISVEIRIFWWNCSADNTICPLELLLWTLFDCSMHLRNVTIAKLVLRSNGFFLNQCYPQQLIKVAQCTFSPVSQQCVKGTLTWNASVSVHFVVHCTGSIAVHVQTPLAPAFSRVFTHMCKGTWAWCILRS